MKNAIIIFLFIVGGGYLYFSSSDSAEGAKTSSSGSVMAVTSPAEFNQILKDNPNVLVDFWAPWCGPCKAMNPVVDRIANNYDVKVVKVNVDDASELASQFGVRSIPTFLIVKNGRIVNRKTGGVHESELTRYFEEAS